MIVEFEPNIYVVNENDGMVNFIIVKRTPSTKNITVYLSTFDGTAIGDFINLTMNASNVLMKTYLMQLLWTIFQL